MLFTLGLVLLALTAILVILGRPADGVSAAFLRNWAVGQIYALATLGSAVVGVTLVLSDLPV